MIPLEIRTIDDSPLHAKEVNLRYGSLRFAAVTGSAQIVERNELFIRTNPSDVVAIFFALKGEEFFIIDTDMNPSSPAKRSSTMPICRSCAASARVLTSWSSTVSREDYLE
ncbi:hypothetical protein [Paeniglutamicibacter antarcticus]|uniref:Uncharacterized protein n=1 Tax=Paeniglutamicibacter antarcticus TaxID=494023 RepID=A0ABP9TIV5_9MICC